MTMIKPINAIAALAVAVLLTACWTPGNPGLMSLFLPRAIGEWDSHSGRSPEEAVVIGNMADGMSLDITETAWVNSHLGTESIIMEAKTVDAKWRKLQAVRCERAGYTGVLIYFDVTNVSDEQRSFSLAERLKK